MPEKPVMTGKSAGVFPSHENWDTGDTLTDPEGNTIGGGDQVTVNVDGTFGDDLTGAPFKTIQAALNKILQIWADHPALNRGMVEVAPGVYTESLAFAYQNKTLLIKLNAAEIQGNVHWTLDATNQNFKSKLIFQGYDLRPAYSTGYLNNGVVGNVKMTQDIASPSRYAAIHFIGTGVLGDIEYDGGGGAALTHLFFCNSQHVGTLLGSGGAAMVVYAWNAFTSGSKGLGGALGKVQFNEIFNVNITAPWVISAPTGGASARFRNVDFDGQAHDFSAVNQGGATWDFDANSYMTYISSPIVPPTAIGIALLDDAVGVGTIGINPVSWGPPGPPSDLQTALDRIAAQLAVLGGPIP